MFDVRNWGQYFSGFYQTNVLMAVCCAVIQGVIFPWSSPLKAEEYTAAQISEAENAIVRGDSQPLGVQSLEFSVEVEARDSNSRPFETNPDELDAVNLDTSKGDQDSRLALTGSRDMQTLGIVNTDASVNFPHEEDHITGGLARQKTNIDLGVQPKGSPSKMMDKGGHFEAAWNDMNEMVDAPLVAATSVVTLPAAGATDAHSQVADVDSRSETDSNSAAGDENAGLPYAVVLALLALIGLVPVARRNDDHNRV